MMKMVVVVVMMILTTEDDGGVGGGGGDYEHDGGGDNKQKFYKYVKRDELNGQLVSAKNISKILSTRYELKSAFSLFEYEHR